MSALRDMARHVMPAPLRRRIVATRLRAQRERNALRTAEAVFSEVYETGRWGEGDTFDSGSGSRGAAKDAYVTLVRELIRETGASRLVDIGCGDFRVASEFVDAADCYVGVDVVPRLVERNTSEFARPGISFVALDAAHSELPDGDICLIRQVLQHLSNDEISSILARCAKFPVVVVTEHCPAPSRQASPNRDKPHGSDTRLDFGSWVDIAAEPFACAPTRERLSASVEWPLYQAGETIRTTVWTPAPVEIA